MIQDDIRPPMSEDSHNFVTIHLLSVESVMPKLVTVNVQNVSLYIVNGVEKTQLSMMQFHNLFSYNSNSWLLKIIEGSIFIVEVSALSLFSLLGGL